MQITTEKAAEIVVDKATGVIASWPVIVTIVVVIMSGFIALLVWLHFKYMRRLEEHYQKMLDIMQKELYERGELIRGISESVLSMVNKN